MVANVEKMFYVKKDGVPWHGEGTALENVATSQEAIEAAELDWKVEKEPIYVSINGAYKPVESKYATIRKDRNEVLGVVGSRYTVLQNTDAFKFFDGIVGIKEAMYHTAGSLGKGERVWILAKLPGYIKVTKDDVVDKYLLLTNSHDGTSAVEMLFSPIRVVCSNTLNLALQTAEKSKSARCRHSMSIGSRIDEVREQLGIIQYQYNIFEQMSQKLVNIQMNKESFNTYLEKIGIITKDEEGKMSTRSENIKHAVTTLFERGRGNDMPEVKGSAWAAFNGVVEYIDYYRGSDDNRANSILYGSGATLKQKAWDLINA